MLAQPISGPVWYSWFRRSHVILHVYPDLEIPRAAESPSDQAARFFCSDLRPRNSLDYNFFLPAALTFAHRALAIVASFARAFALPFLFPPAAGAEDGFPSRLAHLALWAA